MEQGYLFHTKEMLGVARHPCPLQRHSFNHQAPPPQSPLAYELTVGKPIEEDNTFPIQSHLHKLTSWGPNCQPKRLCDGHNEKTASYKPRKGSLGITSRQLTLSAPDIVRT